MESDRSEEHTSGYGSVGLGPFASYCLQATGLPRVTVTFPDGRVEEFEARVTPSCQPFMPIQTTRVSFVPVAGALGRLEVEGSGTVGNPGDVEVVGSWRGPVQLFGGASLFDPAAYRYTAPDGRVLVVSRASGLQSLTDRAGNVLKVTAGGITASHPSLAGSSLGIAFQRDGQGRITRVADPEGRSLVYVYDEAGDLVSVTDREGHRTEYFYLEEPSHHLERIEGPLGRTPIRNEYDESARLVAHVDAFGQRIEYEHDLLGRQEVVRDRTGAQRVLRCT